jgi:hypothetical protein
MVSVSQLLWLENYAHQIRRLLISQDSYEIYLTFAEYDNGYREYLRGNNDRPTAFMTMFQYGPWLTTKAGHMQSLGEVILTFTLQQLPPIPSKSVSPARRILFPATAGASSPQNPVLSDKGKGRAEEYPSEALAAGPSGNTEPESPKKKGRWNLRSKVKKEKEEDNRPRQR